MITIYINGNTHVVQEGDRLVNAIEKSGYDISHRCGGNAQCTTCRVKFFAGEPEMSVKEHAKWAEEESLGINERLSCQIIIADGMQVKVLMPVSESEWDFPGPPPAYEIPE